MADDVYSLRGQFVVEVGFRQAWPYLTLCDNSKTVPEETRLYLDTSFRIGAGPMAFTDGEPDAAAAALAAVADCTVTDVALDASNALTMTFDNGEQMLWVSSEASAFTTHDIWWLGQPH